MCPIPVQEMGHIFNHIHLKLDKKEKPNGKRRTAAHLW